MNKADANPDSQNLLAYGPRREGNA